MARETTLHQHPKVQDGAQSIHRAMAIIRIVADHNYTGVKLSRVAKDVQLPSSTTHRMLSVLADEGMLSYNAMTKSYHLGVLLARLGFEARQYELRHVFRETLERIARQTEDTAYLLVQSGYDVLCVDRVVDSTPIQVLTFDVGKRRPLGVGPGSLAILASLPDEEMLRILRHNARRYGSFVGFGPDDMQRMIHSYRREGYIVNSVTPYTMGVGVALHDKAGKLIGAMSVNAIVSKMNEKRQREIAHLIRSEITGGRI